METLGLFFSTIDIPARVNNILFYGGVNIMEVLWTSDKNLTKDMCKVRYEFRCPPKYENKLIEALALEDSQGYYSLLPPSVVTREDGKLFVYFVGFDSSYPDDNKLKWLSCNVVPELGCNLFYHKEKL